MDALTLTAACILCAGQSSVPANVGRWEAVIAEASARFAIPESWIVQVIKAESGGRTTLSGGPITSSAGAMGLMQIMPDTYAGLRKQYGFGVDPYDPHDNILAGTAYLKAMYSRYGYPFLFAAYNAGPARFDDFLLHGRPLPQVTLTYVNRIVPGGISTFESAAANQKSHPPILKNGSANDLLFVLSDASQPQNSTATSVDIQHINGTNPALVTLRNSSDLFIPLAAPSP